MSQTPVILGVGMNLAPRASNREAARVCNQAGGPSGKPTKCTGRKVRWLVSHPTVFLPNLSNIWSGVRTRTGLETAETRD